MGKKIYDEDLRLNLILNGQGLQSGSTKMVAELGKMEMEMVKMENKAKSLAASIKNLEKNSVANAAQLRAERAELQRLNVAMTARQKAIEDMRRQVGLAGMTVQQLRNHLKALQIQLYNMPGSAGTAIFRQLQAEILATQTRLTTLTTGAGRFAQAWARMEQTINKAGSIVGWFAIVLYGIVRVVSGVITRMKDLEDLIGNVRKNTGLMTSEVWEMKEAFDQWDTRTKTDDLLKLSAVMGKLGITGKEEIMKFVDAANMIQVALGDDLNGSVEDTVNSVGKLTNAFRVFDKINEQTGKNFTLDEAMLRTGDILNELAKSSAASAGTILEYMTRLAGVGELAGFTVAQIGGIGAVLDAMNVPSERGATALQKIMLQLANPKKIQDFGEALGLVGNASESVAVQYEKMLQNDPNSVLLGLMQKFVSTKDGLIELTGGLQQFGVRGQYMTAVLGLMAQNIDVIIEQQAVATKAWHDGTSVLSEYNIMNNNFTASILKQQKIIRAQTDQMNRDAEPAVLKLVTAWAQFVVGVRATVDWIGRHWATIKLLTFAYIALKAPVIWRLSNLMLETFWIRASAAADTLKIFWMKASILWTRNLSAAQTVALASSKFLTIANIALTQGFRAAMVAARGLATSMYLLPGYAMAASIIALASAFYLLVVRKKELTEADKIYKTLHEKISDDYFNEKGNLDVLIGRLKDANSSQGERSNIIKQIQDQYGAYLPSLKKEGITAEEVALSYDKLVEAMGRKIIYDDAIKAAVQNEAAMLRAKIKVDEITAQIAQKKKELAAKGAFEVGIFGSGETQSKINDLERQLKRANIIYKQFADLQLKLNTDIDKVKPRNELNPIENLREEAAKNIAERKKLNDEINAAQAAIDLKNKLLKRFGSDSGPEEAALQTKIDSVKKLLLAYEKIQLEQAKIQSFKYSNESLETFKQRQEGLKSEFEAEELLIKQNGFKLKKTSDDINEELRQAKIKYLQLAIADREKSWRTEDGEEAAYLAMKNELVDAQLAGLKAGKKEEKEDEKKELIELEKQYGIEQSQIKTKYLEGEIKTEDEYNDELLKAELTFYGDKLKLLKVGSKEYIDTYNELLGKKVGVEKSIDDKIIAAQKQFARVKTDRLINEVDKSIALENDRWVEEKQGLESQLIQKEQLDKKEIEYNDIIHKIIEAKEAEHIEKLRKINAVGGGKEIAKLKSELQALTSIGGMTSFTNNDQIKQLFGEKKKVLEKQYAEEKKMAGDNQKAINDAEARYNDENFKLKLEIFDAEGKMNEAKIKMAQDYIAALRNVVGEQSNIGKALYFLSQGLAIADIWIKTAATNAIIYSTALAVFAALGPAAPAAAAAWAASPIAANNVNAALNTGLILAQTIGTVAQWAVGRYPYIKEKDNKKNQTVIGADDGRLYHAAMGGRPVTGVYSQPTLLNMSDGRSLVGERAPELVVDGDTFRRIQLNAPGILKDIYAYAGRGGKGVGSRQKAEGSYPGASTGFVAQPPSNPGGMVRDPELTALIRKLSAQLDKPIKATVNKFGRTGLSDAINDITKFNTKVYKK